jgi:hypothetical protein
VALFENDQYDGLGTQQHCAAVDYRKNPPRRDLKMLFLSNQTPVIK